MTPMIIGKLTPEIKTNTDQVKKIRSVWPISGCIISRRQTGIIAMKVSKYLKYILKFFSLHKIVATKIIIKGLTNSIGWNLGRKKRLSHLLEPFASAPKIGTKNSKNKERKKRYIENLKRFFSLNDENTIKIIIPIKINIKCLKKKK